MLVEPCTILVLRNYRAAVSGNAERMCETELFVTGRLNLPSRPLQTKNSVTTRRNRSDHLTRPAGRGTQKYERRNKRSSERLRQHRRQAHLPTGRHRCDQGVPDIDYEQAGFSLHVLFICTAPITERENLIKETLGMEGVLNVRELMTGEENVHIRLSGLRTRYYPDRSQAGRDGVFSFRRDSDAKRVRSTGSKIRIGRQRVRETALQNRSSARVSTPDSREIFELRVTGISCARIGEEHSEKFILE